ncbi:MAG: hypothetical protein P0Y49_02385 [Candidatus Pedobacter colombiensis]|uniref:Outer membrane protein beta-barrel domain-containing protein n=1 Tax=Candidatus Pedobacter colombiensis TaxID=3121371 RepID=A0AAJ5W8G2_9SPHI|nr:hypothetical protein [Pedobacter sp.]WEK20001.1 MAG: hypothetical protein P0Y49_02385 [Pedobacter sp.]
MRRFLFLLFCTLPVLGFSQANFQKGYILTNSKDTVKGYIDYKERRFNPVTINFVIEPKGEVKVYGLADCAGYGIDGVCTYQRHTVSVSMSRIDPASLSVGADMTSQRLTVFLRLLQAGKNMTLFSYVDVLKSRFYIQDKDINEPVELLNNLYLDPVKQGEIIADVKYVRQIAAEARKFGSAIDEGKLLRLPYKEKNLLKVVSVINDEKLVKAKSKSMRFFAGAGLNISNASYTGSHRLADPGTKSKTSYSPMLTTGMDFLINPDIGKMIIRAELSLLTNKNELSVFSTSRQPDMYALHSFDNFSFEIMPQVIYNFYNTVKTKAFVGIGLGFNFTSTSNNKYYLSVTPEDRVYDPYIQMDFKKFYFAAQLKTGVVINKRFEIAAGFVPPTAITSYSYFNVNMQRVKIGFNYLFGKY